jgi:hypothetical protein
MNVYAPIITKIKLLTKSLYDLQLPLDRSITSNAQILRDERIMRRQCDYHQHVFD